jgi:hypothetical protein
VCCYVDDVSVVSASLLSELDLFQTLIDAFQKSVTLLFCKRRSNILLHTIYKNYMYDIIHMPYVFNVHVNTFIPRRRGRENK